MPSIKHIHTYKRRAESKDIYICADPHCTHYLDRKFLHNKASICPKCKREYLLSWSDLRKINPVCQFCATNVKSKHVKHTLNTLNELFPGKAETTEEIKIIEEEKS